MSLEAYWLEKFSGNIEKKSFPFDHKAPVMNERRIERNTDRLPGEVYSRLLAVSRNSNLRLYKLLVAGVVLLLREYTGGGYGDVIVGEPVRREDNERINTALALKCSFDQSATFKEFFLQVAQVMDAAYAHRRYPMHLLLWHLNLLYAEDESPLFDVIVSLDNLHDNSFLQHINTNIKFSFLAADLYIEGTIEYNAALYEKSTIKRIFRCLANLLETCLPNMDIPLNEIDFLSEGDKKQLLFDFNNTRTDYPGDKSIPEVFAEQVDKGLDRTAVLYQDAYLSYQELDRRASHIAAFLQAKGIDRDEPVGIMAARSLEMIICLVGILKAGGAYLPINLAYPTDRKEYILGNAHIRVLFASAPISCEAVHVPELVSLESPGIYNQGEGGQYEKKSRYYDSAYIMYTSGSSGKPKGVIIEHRGVVRLVKNTDYLIFIERERILQTGALEFDASTFEIWGCLLNGLTLCLAHNDDILIPENLKRLLRKYDVDTILMTSSLLNQMSDVDSSIFCSLDYLLSGGDALSPAHINQVRSVCRRLKIINCYGPTENSTISTSYFIEKDYEENIPIGRPIANSTCYIMNENMRLLPLGVPGELVVGGDGVARGYLNAPELTAEKFKFNRSYRAFGTHILYRTGDLARWLSNGNIEFLGRIDQQVKIRGFRIELGEIENRLLKIDHIKEAVVVDLKDAAGDKYLCAYLTASITLDITDIRDKLSKLLPEFMIPAYFVQVEKIPLNINGKIDRKKLPDPRTIQRSQDYIAPRDKTEKKLVENWAEVLRINKDLIGIDDDFFNMGGQSLKAAVLAAAIHKTFSVKLLIRKVFECPTIRQQAEYIKGAKKVHYSAIQPATKKEYYYLSSAQKRMYFMTQLDKNSTLYNEQLMEIYDRFTTIEKVENAFKKMIERHESLRTSFHQVEGEAVQKIHDYQGGVGEFKIDYYELAANGVIYRQQEGKEGKELTSLAFEDVVAHFVRPFDLSKSPLIRVGLIKIMDSHHVLMMDIHHIIFDGASLAIMLEELQDLIDGKELTPISIQYKDFAEWTYGNEHKEQIEEQEEFWLQEFSGEIPRLNLPMDYPRPSIMTFDGDTLTSELSTERIEKVYRTAKINGATLFIVLLAVYNVLLAKLSGQEEIVVGTVTAGRGHADLQKIIGMFVNTLALRNFPSGRKTFKEFLAELKQKTLAAFDNQDYQFEQLVSKVASRQETGKNPLFDAAFELENESDHKEYLVETLMLTKANPYDFKVKKAKFELALIAVESHEGLLLKLEYSTQLFKKETAERFLGYYKKLLVSICSNVEQKIAEIEMIPEEEKCTLLYEFNKMGWDCPKKRSIHALFEEQAAQNPDNIAVVGMTCVQRLDHNESENRGRLTYRELNKKAGQIAWKLKDKGLNPGDIVAIMVEPCQEMIVGLLGILKAGGAFMPIKDGTPAERINYMLSDSSTRFLLTRPPLARELTFKGVFIYLDDAELYNCDHWDPGPATNPYDSAYVIYTSGSTGKPKGVMVEHHGLVNLCCWHNIYFKVTASDRATKYAGFGFDASVWEIFPYMIIAATLYIVPEEIKLDVQALNRFYEENRITIGFLPTQVAEQFMTIPNNSLRILQVGGDKLKMFVKRDYELYNCYGPTENTVCATSYWVKGSRENIPIGNPIANNQVYILDKNDFLQPVGVPGELCIGGDSLARGYINNPELTAEKFRFNRSYRSYGANILYRTGDLARWLADGNIEFLGRIDSQVKIRGFRIELAEIENRLLYYKEIKEAVVLAREDAAGQKYLCAYVVPTVTPNMEAIRSGLLKTLPDYMIPSFFIQLEQIPLTPNGKIDVRALPAPDVTATAYTAPTNEIEEILAQTWAEVLGFEKTGIHDNFFEIGGDSIKTILISSKLFKWGLTVSVNDFFLYPTIHQLAKHIKKIVRTPAQATVIGNVTLSPIQCWFFENHLPYGRHFNQSILLSREKGFNEDYIKKVFTKIVSHHDALRMVFKIENNVVLQENRGIEGKLFDLESIRLKSTENEARLAEIKSEANRVQRSMDLQTGPLVKLGLFKGPGGNHLLIVIHHLVIDGVSWRILLEDFETGYAQAEKGAEIKFQAKTDSYQYWVQKLEEYAKSITLLRELPFWQDSQETVLKPLPVDHEIQARQRTFENNDIIPMILSEEKTRQLLTGINWAYNTEINDILLTALGLAVKQWAGVDKVMLNLEGHGRELIYDDIDISRTIGWFTTQYPVLLDMEKTEDISYTIKSTKETLRRIPRKGIGYGVLHYLTPPEGKKSPRFTHTPEILFNYLGRFEESSYSIIDRVSEISDPCTGESVAPGYVVNHKIDIEGVTRDGRLYLYLFYNRREYEKETIEKFALLLRTNLEKVIDHCLARKEKQVTPSDLGCNKISIADLERITGYIKSNIREDLEIQSIYPLSPMQSGMLFHWLKDKQSPAYFEQMEIQFRGDIQPLLFEEALNFIVARYDVLRTIFAYEGLPEPLQIVLKQRKAHLHYEDISQLSEADREKYLEEVREKDRQRGFDLFKDQLTRFSLFKIGDQAHILMWTFHHTLMDGWCLGIIRRELTGIYHLLEKGDPVTAAHMEPPRPYAEYIRWLEKQDKEEGLRFWEQYLEGYEEPAGLPRMTKATKSHDYQKAEYHFTIAEELMTGMNRVAGQYQVTINTFFQAIWGILLQRYTNRDDVVFGAIVSGRPDEISGIERMVGLFINMTPIRVKNIENHNFAQLLEKLQVDSLGIKQYEYLPVAEIQARSELKGDLIDHIIVFENYLRGMEAEAGLVAVDIKAFEQTNYDLNIIVLIEKHLEIIFSYNASIYANGFIENMSRHFEMILTQTLMTPFIDPQKIEIMSELEKQVILYDFNKTSSEYPKDKTIQELFEETAVRHCDKIAVVSIVDRTLAKTFITYSELNRCSDQLAYLLREKGVGPGIIVGIMANKTNEMIIGILGILKAGGAYLPLNAEYPVERKKYIMSDCCAKILLTDFQEHINYKVIVIHLQELKIYKTANYFPKDCYSERLAYVMYTSGSTGKPKGVLIDHKAVLRLVKNTDYMKFNENESILQTGALEFDASTFEIWGCLLNGLTLFLAEKNIILNPGHLKRVLHENYITTIWMTSALFNQMFEMDADIFSGLKYLLTGGDIVSPLYVNRLRNHAPGITVINGYGPTENTTFSTTHTIQQCYERSIPIGKPIANSTCYILDKKQRLVPVGIPGELFLGGDGVARGYLNRPELTAERFIEYRSNRPYKTYIIYKTGDLARFLSDGNIEFLGRSDFQVKIRGFRIELGEIESELMKLPEMKDAIVLAKNDNSGGQYLCAYLISDKPINTTAIRKELAGKMPEYMIPAYFVQLEKIPLTPNGKLDRKALPDPETTIIRQYTAPTNETEKILADVWTEVLDKKVGIHDNFFEIGGDSIKTMLISGRLQKRQIKININDFFAHPTIHKLAIHLNKVDKTDEVKRITRDESLIAIDIQRDYDNYLEQVKQEKWPNLADKNDYKHILITGAAGYLGAYLTHELLQLTDATLYLPIRGKSHEQAEERLKKRITFYFGADFYNTQKHRLIILESNLAKKQLGLSGPQYEKLSETVQAIIHSAANVKHFGDYAEFYKDNVEATEQLLELALIGKKKTFHFISTMDTGSGDIPGKDYLVYTEYSHDEGQESENVYVKSKFEAEKRVLSYREIGLNTSIYRVGNMTFHSETGRFQENIEENFFYSMLKAFIKIGFWTDRMKKLEFDLSFVNLAARAIVQLLTQKQFLNETYHICNPHSLTWNDMEILLKKTGVALPEVEPGDSRDFFSRFEGNSEYEKIIERIKLYSSIWEEKPATLTVAKMDRTVMLLKKLGFQWPEVTADHIAKMIAHCKEVGFI